MNDLTNMLLAADMVHITGKVLEHWRH